MIIFFRYQDTLCVTPYYVAFHLIQTGITELEYVGYSLVDFLDVKKQFWVGKK